MKNKTYSIKTTKDIINAVNKDNVDDFLKDFSTWLNMVVLVKTRLGNAVLDSNFIWNDDGQPGKVKSIEFNFTNKKN